MGPLFHVCSPSPGRSGSVCAQVGFVFAGVRLVQALPPSPSSACLGVLPSASAFSFPLPFQGSPAPGKVCWCWCSLLVPPLLFCVPRLGFLLSNIHFTFIFISLFILIFTSQSGPQLWSPLGGVCVCVCVCVCVEHLNRCKTSTSFLDSRGTARTEIWTSSVCLKLPCSASVVMLHPAPCRNTCQAF